MQLYIRIWQVHKATDFDSCSVKVSEVRCLQCKVTAANISDNNR